MTSGCLAAILLMVAYKKNGDNRSQTDQFLGDAM